MRRLGVGAFDALQLHGLERRGLALHELLQGIQLATLFDNHRVQLLRQVLHVGQIGFQPLKTLGNVCIHAGKCARLPSWCKAQTSIANGAAPQKAVHLGPGPCTCHLATLSMQKLVVILGTNASGKSELGIRLARQFDAEVVSADSRQVYRGLDLGTGKITPAQAAGVKHHLIDVANAEESYSLAQYQRAAYEAIDSIAAAGKLPLLVGGTGLYISAVVEGYQLVEVPPNESLRAELESLPPAELVARLEQADAETARRIDKSNPRRLVRALEIAAAGHGSAAARQRAPRYDCLQLGLTWPREVLEQRIEKRLRERLAAGMIDEVAGLRARGVSDARLDKLGLEYRYILRYLRGELGTLEDLHQQLLIAIRQFAKEQVTWFKRDRRILWLDPFADYFEEASHRIRDWLTTPPATP